MKSNKIGIIIAVIAIVIAIIAIAVACYTVATVKAEKEEETVSSKKEEKSNADEVLENARKAREESRVSTAKEAITTILGSIQTEYYRTAGKDDDAEEYLTAEILEKEMKDYEITSCEWKNKKCTIKFEDEKNKYVVKVNDQLTITSFDVEK